MLTILLKALAEAEKMISCGFGLQNTITTIPTCNHNQKRSEPLAPAQSALIL
jgi:hypothetical protein